MDSGMYGVRYKSGRYNKNQKEAIESKSILMGAVERGGDIRVSVVKDQTAQTHGEFLQSNVEKENTRLLTDKTNRLNKVAIGYDRHTVDHHLQEYVRGDIHINTIEAFWSHVKRSIKGTHKVVSKKHLQSYLDAFVWHYNNQHNDRERFENLVGILLSA